MRLAVVLAAILFCLGACADQRSGERPRPGAYAGVTLGGTR